MQLRNGKIIVKSTPNPVSLSPSAKYISFHIKEIDRKTGVINYGIQFHNKFNGSEYAVHGFTEEGFITGNIDETVAHTPKYLFLPALFKGYAYCPIFPSGRILEKCDDSQKYAYDMCQFTKNKHHCLYDAVYLYEIGDNQQATFVSLVR